MISWRPVALVLVLAARVASADDAEQLYDQGQAAFDMKRFDAAIDFWQRSYDLSQEPGLLFNLAQAYRLRAQKHDCAKAAASFQRFIELDPSSTQRRLAEELLQETQKCAEREADAGPATPNGAEVAPRHDAEVHQPVRGAHPGATTKLIGIGVAGGGALLFATGVYFGHKASSLGDQVTKACTIGCDWGGYGPRDADGRSAQTKMYIFDGLGLAAILAGGLLYWLGANEHGSQISISSRPDGGAVSWSGRW